MHNVEQGAMTVTFTHLGMHFSNYYDLLQIIQSMAFLLYYKVCTSSDQKNNNIIYNFLYYNFFSKAETISGRITIISIITCKTNHKHFNSKLTINLI